MATKNMWQSTNPASVISGGTQRSSLNAYSVLTGGTSPTSAVQSVASLGSAGQFLLSGGPSSLPAWGNITPSTSSMYLIQSQTASNASQLVFSIPSTYTNYLLVYTNAKVASVPSSQFNGPVMTFSSDGGSSYFSTNYVGDAIGGDGATSNSAFTYPVGDAGLGSNGSKAPIGFSSNVGTSFSMSGSIFLYNFGATTGQKPTYKGTYICMNYASSSTAYGRNSVQGYATGYYDVVTVMNSIKITWYVNTSGNINFNGFFSLYGFAQ